ncbi:transposase domain protein [Fusobacterium sp. CM1]|nr:transposase domain protein [Fusobacterium sp. CM1]
MLNIVQNGNYPNLKIKNLAQKAVSKLYKEDKRLFFNVDSGDVNSPKGIVKYLGRYLARAPIAEYKIYLL